MLLNSTPKARFEPQYSLNKPPIVVNKPPEIYDDSLIDDE
jgi:hypothetical protein